MASRVRALLAVLELAALVACEDRNFQVANCDQPIAAATRDERITVGVPQDFDPLSAPAPTTVVPITVFMPERCPGDTFPLILYGHGFGESRATRNSELIDDGNVDPVLARGYVEIKFDERGHGDARPPQGGGWARLIDPNAEVQDARAILDWAHDHAAEIAVATEPGTGIAKDLRVGTLGGSYGGGFQMLLAALDPRVDVIAADRTWHNLFFSLIPGDALKTFARLLSLFVQLDEISPGLGVTTTPWMRTLANQVGPLAPTANLVRTRAELAAALASPLALPRPVSEEEIDGHVRTHAVDYFEAQEAAGAPWGFGETTARLRAVPALFTQGQRDVLFNATEAYWNAKYFGATGGDVRVLTHEDGHPNPLAGGARGQWACGAFDAQTAILDWFDRHLKGIESGAIPRVCISLLGSADLEARPIGVTLDEFPVGSLEGEGAVPVAVATVRASIPLGSGTNGVFVPIATIAGEGRVLAGIPRLGGVSVSPGLGSVRTAIAIVGVAIRRDGAVRLVDEQVTGFVAGTHDGNRGVEHPGEGVLLPGVGAELEDDDELGLVFYEQHAQFSPVVAPQNLGGLTTVLPGLSALPPLEIFALLEPVLSLVNVPNPYEVVVTDVEMPVFVPGVYRGSGMTEGD